VRAAKPVSVHVTRYMRDGSILPRVSTSCDDLQRRITKSSRSVRPRTAAFTSPRLASSRLREVDLGKIGFRLHPGEGGGRRATLSIDAKGSAQTDLDLEYSRYCGSSRRETDRADLRGPLQTH